MSLVPLLLAFVQPFFTAGAGGYPVTPRTPFNDQLVMISTYTSDIVGGHILQDSERTFVWSLGDDISDMEKNVFRGAEFNGLQKLPKIVFT